MDIDVLYNLILLAIPVIVAITFHEAAHGYVALHFGDSTAKRLPVRPAMIPVYIHLALVLMLGLWIPPFLAEWYRQAARLIG